MTKYKQTNKRFNYERKTFDLCQNYLHKIPFKTLHFEWDVFNQLRIKIKQ